MYPRNKEGFRTLYTSFPKQVSHQLKGSLGKRQQFIQKVGNE